ncbi:MAG: hypothetical protein D6698_03980 [Gammaproteobacteria bacterium]|nr:MAG: hypothetical protein D6698_03980 [Gammaproteobacteria bacterium]
MKIGIWTDVTSTRYSRQALALLEKLAESGHDAYLIPERKAKVEQIPPKYRRFIPAGEINFGNFDLVVARCVPPRYPLSMETKDKIVGYTDWETTIAPLSWRDPMLFCRHIITHSKSAAVAFQNIGCRTPISVAAPMVDVEFWSSKDNLERVIPSDEKVNFLCIGEWTPRENQEDLIVAFCRAFQGNPNVRLIFNTWTTETTDAKVRQAIRDRLRSRIASLGVKKPPAISFVFDVLDDESFRSLIYSTDVVVVASKGVGSPEDVIKAMLMEKLVVAPNHTALENLVNDNTALPFGSYLSPSISGANSLYTLEQTWHQPDILGLCSALSKAYVLSRSALDEVKNIARAARQTAQKYSTSYNALDAIKEHCQPGNTSKDELLASSREKDS